MTSNLDDVQGGELSPPGTSKDKYHEFIEESLGDEPYKKKDNYNSQAIMPNHNSAKELYYPNTRKNRKQSDIGFEFEIENN